MFRSENELLCSLINAINRKNKKEVKQEKNFSDIEKYRDHNGFIDATQITDFNELDKLIKLLEEKNAIEKDEKINNKQTLQEKTEYIANSLKNMFNVDNIKVSVSTPEGESFVKFGFDDNDNVEEKNENNTSIKEHTDEEKETQCEVNELIDEDCENYVCDNECDEIVQLIDAGGMYNPAYYNAVLHICEYEHFMSNEVYTDFEELPSDYSKVIYVLLPNVWGKIFENAAIDFAKKIKNGDEVYIINHENFDLIKIKEPMDLLDYTMNFVQENYI